MKNTINNTRLNPKLHKYSIKCQLNTSTSNNLTKIELIVFHRYKYYGVNPHRIFDRNSEQL